MQMQLINRSRATGRCIVVISRFFNSSSVEYDEALHQYTKLRGYRLICAQVFFRHGDRTPLNKIEGLDTDFFRAQTLKSSSFPIYPFELAKEDDTFDERNFARTNKREGMLRPHKVQWIKGSDVPLGALTSTGAMSMRSLGSKLRRRYIDLMRLLPEDVSPSSVYCRSTCRRRNIDSLGCFLTGFFNYNSAQQENPEPALIFRAPKSADPFAINMSEQLERVLQAGGLIYERYPEMAELRMELVKALGLCRISGQVDGFIDEVSLSHLYDDLFSRTQHGLKLPRRVKDLMPSINRYSTLEFCYRRMGCQSGWLDVGLPSSIGPAFDIILKNVSALIEGEASRSDAASQPVMRLYSTHDVFLIPFLMTTGGFNGEWPPFSSYIALEVYEAENGDLCVMLHYNDQLMMELPYDDWKAHFKKFSTTVEEYHELVNRAVPVQMR